MRWRRERGVALRLVAVALLAILARSGLADAASVTGDLAIRVTVMPSACSIENATLDFGTYVAGQEGPLDATTTVSFLGCGPGTVRLELDGGGAGQEASRRLVGPAGGGLTYGLYQDSSRARPAGSGGAAAALSLAARGNGTLALYGRISGHQLTNRGRYTDTVGMTLSF